jgi:ribosomal protein S7
MIRFSKPKLKKNSKLLISPFILKLRLKFYKLKVYKFIKKQGDLIIKHNKIILSKNYNSFIVVRKNSNFLPKLYFQRKTFLKLNQFGYFNLYNKFINFIFKSGKKSFWENAFSDVFLKISKKLHYSRNFILLKIFLRLHTRVEVKKVKMRRRIYIIPTFINFKRRFFLGIKWLLDSIKKNKKKISLKEKLLTELLVLLKKKTSFGIKQLENNNLISYKNRSNMHFRW